MGDRYEVARILGRRISVKDGAEYLIYWDGYTLEACTWEPVSNLNCPEFIDLFEQRVSEQRQRHRASLGNGGGGGVAAVDRYENKGIATLVDEGLELFPENESAFDDAPEDFAFVAESIAGQGGGNAESPADDSDKRQKRLAAVHVATLGWHRQGDGSSIRQAITRIRGSIQVPGGQVYYLAEWSDKALTWEAPAAFDQAIGVLSRYENAHYASERKELGKSLRRLKASGRLDLGKAIASQFGMAAAPTAMASKPVASATPPGGGAEAAQWFNLASSNLVTGRAREPPRTRRPGGAIRVVSSPEAGSSESESVSSTQLVRGRLRRGLARVAYKEDAGGNSNSSESPPQVRRMEQLSTGGARAAGSDVWVEIDHVAGSEIKRRKTLGGGVCAYCQMAADCGRDRAAWWCSECGMRMHRACYRQLDARFAFGAAYLDALDDSAQGSMRQCVSLLVRLDAGGAPARLEDAFDASHVEVAAIIGARVTTEAEARAREAQLRAAGVARDALYTRCAAVRVVWRGLGASEATWEPPPSPARDAAEHARWAAAYDAWRLAETVSLRARKQHARAAHEDSTASIKEFSAQPEYVRGGSLYAYQLEGANWLLRHWARRASVVLADEMGLGKTVQVIAFLLMVYHSTIPAGLARDAAAAAASNRGTFPFLVVVPASLVANWAAEFRAWAPALAVAQLSARAADRRVEVGETVFRSQGARRDVRCHVVLASYEAVALADAETAAAVRGITWQAVVVDEGHRLKNDATKTYRALAAVRARQRVLLTGTPLQNDLRELGSVLGFVDPPRAATLREATADAAGVLRGDAAEVARVHALIRPYFLRRTKADVPRLVPPKHEVILPVSLSRLQRELYRATLARNVRLLQGISDALHGSGGESPIGSGDQPIRLPARRSLGNILMEVRQIVSHPYVLPHVEPAAASAGEAHARLVAAGGKLQALHALLPEVLRRGHRVLVFAQFKRTLDILEDYLAGEGTACERIDGDTPALARQLSVDRFNAPASAIPVFLSSTRTGGLGLNLVGADVVVIYDCDFNPQADLQAVARAHRIGQRRPVTVFKLVAAGAAEEKIVKAATRKLLLDHVVIGGLSAEAPSGGEQPTPQDTARFESCLREDALALFDAAAEERAESQAIVYDHARVAALLDQCEQALAAAEAEQGAADEALKQTTTKKKTADSARPLDFARVWTLGRDGSVADVAAETEDEPPRAADAGDVWAALLAKQEKEGEDAADMDVDESAAGGHRLRARKQQINYHDEVGGGGSDVDDDYRDEQPEEKTPPPVSASTASSPVLVRRDEVAEIVRRHTAALLAMYRRNAADVAPHCTPAWDRAVADAFAAMRAQPRTAGAVSGAGSPPLLFAMPANLRLAARAEPPPQPPPSGSGGCLMCGEALGHGALFCPRISEPPFLDALQAVKRIPHYWVHPSYHQFVEWYAVQYTWFVLAHPAGSLINADNARRCPNYVVDAAAFRDEVRAERSRRRLEAATAKRRRAIHAEAARRALVELKRAQDTRLYSLVSASNGTSATNSSTLLYREPLPPSSSLSLAAAAATVGDVGAATPPPDTMPALYTLGGIDGVEHERFLRKVRLRGIALRDLSAGFGDASVEELRQDVRTMSNVQLSARKLSHELMCTASSSSSWSTRAASVYPMVSVVRNASLRKALVTKRLAASLRPLSHSPRPPTLGLSGASSSSSSSSSLPVPSPPEGVAHELRLAMGKMLKLRALLESSYATTREVKEGEVLKAGVKSIADKVAASQRAGALALGKLCEEHQFLKPLAPLACQLIDGILQSSSSSAGKNEAAGVAVTQVLMEILLWVKTNVRDVKDVSACSNDDDANRSGYGVVVQLAPPLMPLPRPPTSAAAGPTAARSRASEPVVSFRPIALKPPAMPMSAPATALSAAKPAADGAVSSAAARSQLSVVASNATSSTTRTPSLTSLPSHQSTPSIAQAVAPPAAIPLLYRSTLSKPLAADRASPPQYVLPSPLSVSNDVSLDASAIGAKERLPSNAPNALGIVQQNSERPLPTSEPPFPSSAPPALLPSVTDGGESGLLQPSLPRPQPPSLAQNMPRCVPSKSTPEFPFASVGGASTVVAVSVAAGSSLSLDSPPIPFQNNHQQQFAGSSGSARQLSASDLASNLAQEYFKASNSVLPGNLQEQQQSVPGGSSSQWNEHIRFFSPPTAAASTAAAAGALVASRQQQVTPVTGQPRMDLYNPQQQQQQQHHLQQQSSAHNMMDHYRQHSNNPQMQMQMQLLQQQHRQQLQMLQLQHFQQQQQRYHPYAPHGYASQQNQLNLQQHYQVRHPTSPMQMVTPVTGFIDSVAAHDGALARSMAAPPMAMISQQQQQQQQPPVYIESLMPGMVTMCDMACALCDSPLHGPSQCASAGSISSLTKRRVFVEENMALPPNTREMMLSIIDRYMELALRRA
ncbi:hypothetical protein EV174_003431 [Coemansia sp. RSA 2320]|nr:hypothetical protein EV174_003431 [Coemansia sp. RSA 2320]